MDVSNDLEICLSSVKRCAENVRAFWEAGDAASAAYWAGKVVEWGADLARQVERESGV